MGKIEKLLEDINYIEPTITMEISFLSYRDKVNALKYLSRLKIEYSVEPNITNIVIKTSRINRQKIINMFTNNSLSYNIVDEKIN